MNAQSDRRKRAVRLIKPKDSASSMCCAGALQFMSAEVKVSSRVFWLDDRRSAGRHAARSGPGTGSREWKSKGGHQIRESDPTRCVTEHAGLPLCRTRQTCLRLAHMGSSGPTRTRLAGSCRCRVGNQSCRSTAVLRPRCSSSLTRPWRDPGGLTDRVRHAMQAPTARRLHAGAMQLRCRELEGCTV